MFDKDQCDYVESRKPESASVQEQLMDQITSIQLALCDVYEMLVTVGGD